MRGLLGVLSLLCALCAASPAFAQSSAAPPRVADARYIALTAANFAATGIDLGYAFYRVGNGTGREVGPLGRHSLPAALALATSVDTVAAMFSYRWKRAERDAKLEGREYRHVPWWSIQAVTIAPHVAGITISLALSR